MSFKSAEISYSGTRNSRRDLLYSFAEWSVRSSGTRYVSGWTAADELDAPAREELKRKLGWAEARLGVAG